jgi:hypothetical protein
MVILAISVLYIAPCHGRLLLALLLGSDAWARDVLVLLAMLVATSTCCTACPDAVSVHVPVLLAMLVATS